MSKYHSTRTLVEMARAAQHDDRQSTGKLYGDLADRIEALEAALREISDRYRNTLAGEIASITLAPEQD